MIARKKAGCQHKCRFVIFVKRVLRCAVLVIEGADKGILAAGFRKGIIIFAADVFIRVFQGIVDDSSERVIFGFRSVAGLRKVLKGLKAFVDTVRRQHSLVIAHCLDVLVH